MRRYAFMLLLVIVAGATGLWLVAARPARATRPAPWPAMTLVYQVDVRHHGASGPFDTEVWKVTYQDEHHWRKELLQSTAAPQQVGSYTSYQGTTFTDYSAALNATVTTPNHDTPMIPEEWLLPGRDRVLERQGYTKLADAGANRVRYQRVEALHCVADAERRGITQPTTCATTPDYQGQETIIYRTDFVVPVPVEIIDQAGDVVHRHIVVTQLTSP